jgi:hypothetical protein
MSFLGGIKHKLNFFFHEKYFCVRQRVKNINHTTQSINHEHKKGSSRGLECIGKREKVLELGAGNKLTKHKIKANRVKDLTEAAEQFLLKIVLFTFPFHGS